MESFPIRLVVHLLSMLMMAAPFYMLIIVNELALFGGPLNYSTDRYMENIIRRNAVRCFIFQGTILASGVALVWAGGYGWDSLLTVPSLIIKWVALLGLAGLFSHIHFSLTASDRNANGIGETGRSGSSGHTGQDRRLETAAQEVFGRMPLLGTYGADNGA
jgi:hypothetical protein